MNNIDYTQIDFTQLTPNQDGTYSYQAKAPNPIIITPSQALTAIQIQLSNAQQKMADLQSELIRQSAPIQASIATMQTTIDSLTKAVVTLTPLIPAQQVAPPTNQTT